MIVVRRVKHKSSALFSAADEWRKMNAKLLDPSQTSDLDIVRSTARIRDSGVYSGFASKEHFDRSLDEIFKGRADPNFAPEWVKGMKDGEYTALHEDLYRKARDFQQKTGSKISQSVPPPPPPKTLQKPSNSKALLAGLALVGAAGVVGTGAYFIRRRRSKKGKTIVERVRR